MGPVVILTDGDVVFQPRKIERSGLFEAVAKNILIYIHKELELADVERRYPAEHYVLVDDKLRILLAIKEVWGERVTTVFPKQGQGGRTVDVIVATSLYGNKYLKTTADGEQPDNLLSLPECP